MSTAESVQSVSTIAALGVDSCNAFIHEHNYVYQPIEGEQIRVLCLAPGRDEDDLIADFDIVSLSSRPCYRAISYTWGPANFTKPLHIGNSGMLWITPSLDAALRNFRNPVDNVRLWADAVCINQIDVPERSRQVEMIADVYRAAEIVLVWLGGATDIDKLAFWTVRRLSQYPPFDFKGVKNCEAWMHDKFDSIMEFLTNGTSPDDVHQQCPCCGQSLGNISDPWKAILAVVRLLGSPWFTRLWVLQEVAVARTVIFFRGRHHVNMTEFTLVIEHLAYVNPTIDISSQENDDFQWHTTNAATVLCERVRSYQRSAKLKHGGDLLPMLVATWHLQTQDLRDRLWAIRALTDAKSYQSLRPDYSLPLSELWRRIAIILLQYPQEGYKNPAIVLALAGRKKPLRNLTLPSWVPNFAVVGHYATRLRSRYQIGLGPMGKLSPRAGGDSSFAPFMTPSDADMLYVRAVWLADVERICKGSQRPETGSPHAAMSHVNRLIYAKDILVPWYLRCRRFFDEHANPVLYPDLEQTCAALLHQGYDFHDESVLEYYENSPLAPGYDHEWFYRNWCRRACIKDRTLRGGPIDLGYMRDILQPLFLPYFRNAPIDITKKLAITTSGRLGWIPEHAQQGDRVCLFQGAPFPFIVRDDDNDASVVVIGDAYIHGIMGGEAWPEDDDDDIIFILGLS